MGTAKEQSTILVINTGSSSIKMSLFSVQQKTVLLTASLDGIGQAQSELSYILDGQSSQNHPVNAHNHLDGLHLLLNIVDQHFSRQTIVAISQRVVHGGSRYHKATIIDNQMISYLESLKLIDSEHMPLALQVINQVQQLFTNVPQVACFDTGFFHNLPQNSKLLTIGEYKDEELRRYGFHGLSYAYLQEAFGQLAGQQAVNGKVIYAHLGSGCSLAATLDGKPIDTTMGLAPSSGIMMSTRSGDVDPELPMYLNKKYSLSFEDFTKLTSKNSGLLGVSELSADMKTLIENESTNPKAAAAVNMFVYQVKKTIGSYAAALGGLNSLIFSGGMGEQSWIIRQRICLGLEFLGINVDNNANKNHASLISGPNSTVGVHVIHTDESQTIYKQTMQLLQLNPEELA